MLGLNALHIAARCNNDVAMKMLLAAGGDVEIQDNNNNSVLSWTTSYKVSVLFLLQYVNSCLLSQDTLYDTKYDVVMLCGV